MGSDSKKERTLFLLILSLLILIPVVSASDVAYVYEKEFRIDDNVIDVFEEQGLSVDLIQYDDVRRTDFSEYRLLFVGNERFRNPMDIPVNDYPSIVINRHHGDDWGYTDRDGVSSLASNSPLSVKKGGSVLQVYTQAFFRGSSIAIPYYYLATLNKAPGFETVAQAYNGGSKLGDTIAYGFTGMQLKNNDYLNGNLCFYGISESDYWTSNARNMFDECTAFVATACEEDSDCGEDITSETYCSGDDVYEDLTRIGCENPGSLDATCNADVENVLVESCEDACVEGACIEYVCDENIDCDDGNSGTFDECVNPNTVSSFCRNTEVNCISDLDCGITGFIGENFCTQEDVYKDYQTSTCVEAGTLESNCVIDVSPRLIQECDDGDDLTSDSCHMNGIASCIHDPIFECIEDGDCGEVESVLICDGDDVVQLTTSPICTGSNECSEETSETLIEECAVGCFEGGCLPSTDVHDIGLVDFTNSINGIRLETPEGDVVSENGVLICNEDYKVYIDVKNFGDFEEDVEFDGSIGDIDFSHFSTSVEPGESKLKFRTVNFALEGGFYNVIVEAIIDEDENLDNNIVSREIEVLCEELECSVDSQCGETEIKFSCVADYLFEITTSPLCTNENICSQVVNEVLIDECEFGCSEGSCNVGECLEDGDCGDVNIQRLCVNEDVYEVTRSPICTQQNECSNEVSQELVESCDFGCEYGECLEDVGECVGNSDCGVPMEFLVCVGTTLTDRSVVPICSETSMCQIAVNDIPLEVCEFGCSNGSCNAGECLNNGDCGSANVQNLCVNDDVYEVTRNPICTQSNQCFLEVGQILKEDCEFGCEYGECLEAVGSNSQFLCVNDELHEVTRTEICNGSGDCRILVEQELVEVCEDSCFFGECVDSA